MFILCLVLPAWSEETLESQVVDEALRAIGFCTHWGGETGDQSDERNKQIAEGIERDCPEAQRKATKAYELYPKDMALCAGILELIDSGYFEVSDEEKKKICDTSAAHFQNEFLKSKKRDPYFRAVCPSHAADLYDQ